MTDYLFLALFTAAKVGVAPASAPTVDVVDVTTGSLVVTAGTATALASVTGMYKYLYSGAADLQLVALFKTATTTVDLQHVPSYTPTQIVNNPTAAANAAAVRSELAAELASVDVPISTRLATAGYTAAPTVGAIADQVWDEATAGHASAGSTGAALATAGAAADPLLNPVPGTYPAGSAGAALARIGSAQVTVTSPVAQDGKAIELVFGDDYYAIDGRSLDFTLANQPTIIGATVALKVQAPSGALSFAATVLDATTARVELAGTQIATIGVGVWDYDLEVALVNAHVATVVLSGEMTVLRDVR